MGETRVQYIPNVAIPTDPMPYPRYIGEILRHPFTPNTLLEVLEVWDRDEVWGNEFNSSGSYWTALLPRRDESSKYPIYKCRVNGTNEQWIVFTWIVLSDGAPVDLLR